MIASSDKDLRQIPGWNYNPDKGGHLQYLDDIDGLIMFYLQALGGDPTDGYPGCPKIGPIKARKIILRHTEDHGSGIVRINESGLWEEIVLTYASKGLSESYALTQARVARILQWEDYDQEKKEVKLWTPPV